MKFTSALSLALVGFTVVAAQQQTTLPELPANNTCEDPKTYAQCRSNTYSKSCLSTDTLCLCLQIDNALACINSCNKDTRISNFKPTFVQNFQASCSNVTLPTGSSAIPTSGGSGTGSTTGGTSAPTKNILNGGSSLSSVSIGTASIVLGAIALLL
ncbi:hypothetical protein K493DRAFT_310632 [Basidiobolus meristosporus CBS 931.73]|uniref:Extracellular membrane protein CFEM domain-containing protein n=1 Tax=Basidiobolus meristosporus CBS 931.73 TaxID=1314790 RepID=A0A1Y1Z7S6_9FUNG|nr:hypothetical protein K493DRAFT_310632 [Basidiobolus meristosporus CBS 931.73]|eukprot:ORY06301.1 hypothetical protein K493DRAFT_310632 [Basidiobolus meristosporus CBS 931.73]